ncbi:MAG TPA: hypothetical protein VMI30_03380 [Stellaceae bacterium]|nr:hypothetical protein [Stellaceae bacterium]
MRPLYDARLSDLGPRDMVKITCQACAHITRLPRSYFERFARTEPYQPVVSLKRRLGCTRCRTRGYVDISIEWRG